jgi:hypothetical protein
MLYKFGHNKTNIMIQGVNMVPRCLNCGNTERFASSLIVSSRQYHEPYGMSAKFNQDGGLVHLENNNAPFETYNQAYKTPEKYFDTCHTCGSTNLLW